MAGKPVWVEKDNTNCSIWENVRKNPQYQGMAGNIVKIRKAINGIVEI